MISPPLTAALRIGWRLSVITTAWMMNGRYVSFCPVCASKSARSAERTRATRVRSNSKNVVTCVATRIAIPMCSDVRRRSFDIGSTRSPGHAVAVETASGAGAGVETAACSPLLGTGIGAPLSRNPSRSRLVTRPAMPLPASCEISTPCSAAMRRTSGELFVRMRSSKPLFGARGAACRG